MSMSFSADPSGTFGTIKINGVSQLIINNDGTLESPSGKIIATGEGILGTVSQAAGIPTGAIIESGSNANGEYEKFASGLAICRHFMQASNLSNSVWTFPLELPALSVLGTPVGGNYLSGFKLVTTSTTAATFNIWNNVGGREAESLTLVLIGRWF